MIKNDENFSLSAQVANVAIAYRKQDLSLAELLALHSTLGLLILNNPKSKSILISKLNQIETRIIKARGRSSRQVKLAEELLNLINSST